MCLAWPGESCTLETLPVLSLWRNKPFRKYYGLYYLIIDSSYVFMYFYFLIILVYIICCSPGCGGRVHCGPGRVSVGCAPRPQAAETPPPPAPGGHTPLPLRTGARQGHPAGLWVGRGPHRLLHGLLQLIAVFVTAGNQKHDLKTPFFYSHS